MSRLIAGCIAAAVIASLAVASSASAAPFLTKPTGTPLSPGSTIVGTQLGHTVFTTGLGNVTCTTGKIEGKLATNSTASGSKLEINSVSIDSCHSWTNAVIHTPNPATNGLPWCLEATEANDNGKIRGGGCGAAPRAIRFFLDFSFGTCTYQRTSAASGFVTTDVSGQQAAITFTEQEWTRVEGDPFLCPTSGKLDMQFTLENSAGEAIYYSS